MVQSSLNDFLEAGFVLFNPVSQRWYLGSKPNLLSTGDLPLSSKELQSMHLSHPLFDFSDFPSWFTFRWSKNWSSREVKEFIDLGEDSPSHSFTPSKPFEWQGPERSYFEREFSEIQEQLDQGRLRKVVPIVVASSPQFPSRDHLAYLIRKFATNPCSVFVYGFWHGSEGCFGVSPESLFTWSGNLIRTEALAGTSSEEKSEEFLLTSDKDRFEHQLVVEDIAHKLKGLGSVSVKETTVWGGGNVYHLKTPVEVAVETLPSLGHVESLIKKMHPTAALSGTPSTEAWEWLNKRPSSRLRKRFGSPFTVIESSEVATSVVAIRNIQWNSSGSVLCAGCGVVKESHCESEWEELKLKIAFTRRFLEV